MSNTGEIGICRDTITILTDVNMGNPSPLITPAALSTAQQMGYYPFYFVNRIVVPVSFQIG